MVCVAVGAGASPLGRSGTAGVDVVVGAVPLLAISMSAGRDRILSGALNIRRPAIAPPMRLPSDPIGPDGAV